jgi:hypothetical protein
MRCADEFTQLSDSTCCERLRIIPLSPSANFLYGQHDAQFRVGDHWQAKMHRVTLRFDAPRQKNKIAVQVNISIMT